MQILILYHYFCTPKGYWGTRVYENARRWVAEGHSVHVITAPYEKSDVVYDPEVPIYEVEGIKVEVCNAEDSNRWSTFKRMRNALRFTSYCSRKVLSMDYDLLIASSGPLSLGIPLILAKRLRRKVTVFEVRDLWPAVAISLGKISNPLFKAMTRALERWTYGNSDLVVVASVGQEQHIRKRFPELRLHCIPNASDIEVFANEEPTEKAAHNTLLHLGSLGFIHNAGYWMDVAIHLKEETIDLHFVGDGAERKTLETIKDEQSLDHVHFKGLVPKEELAQYTGKAKLSLFSTLETEEQYTCSPNKIFDSFAAGLPLVQTTTGWIKELVEETQCGINVPLNDPEAAAASIKTLLADEPRRLQMAKNAKELARTRFNRDQLAEEYLTLLTELI